MGYVEMGYTIRLRLATRLNVGARFGATLQLCTVGINTGAWMESILGKPGML